MTNPASATVELRDLSDPRAMRPDRGSAHSFKRFVSPPLEQEGLYRFATSLSGTLSAAYVRDVFVVNTKFPPVDGRTLRIGVAGVWPVLRQQLAAIPGIVAEDFTPGVLSSVVISSGLTDQSTPAQKLSAVATPV